MEKNLKNNIHIYEIYIFKIYLYLSLYIEALCCAPETKKTL